MIKSFWSESLRNKIGIMEVMIPIWLMPPAFRKGTFSQRLVYGLINTWCRLHRMRKILFFIDRPRNITLAGEPRLKDTYLGCTRMYHVASITLNVRATAKCIAEATGTPLVGNLCVPTQLWQTLLHEMAHAVAMPEPRDIHDHGLSFYWRMVKAYIFAWYYVYLRRR